jgi:hypothetical protein
MCSNSICDRISREVARKREQGKERGEAQKA